MGVDGRAPSYIRRALSALFAAEADYWALTSPDGLRSIVHAPASRCVPVARLSVETFLRGNEPHPYTCDQAWRAVDESDEVITDPLGRELLMRAPRFCRRCCRPEARSSDLEAVA